MRCSLVFSLSARVVLIKGWHAVAIACMVLIIGVGTALIDVIWDQHILKEHCGRLAP